MSLRDVIAEVFWAVAFHLAAMIAHGIDHLRYRVRTATAVPAAGSLRPA